MILAAGLFAALPLLSTLPLFGQASTRAEEIEHDQQKRAVQIEADRPNKVERQLVEIEGKKLPERILSGVNGFGVKLGGLVAGSGFAIGPQYLREGLFSGNMTFGTSAEASLNLYQKYELQMTLPKLLRTDIFLI